jgi:hypothetical protein
MIVSCLSSEAFLGWSKVAIGVGTLLSLASEVDTKLFGHILWKNVHGVDGWVTEVKHTQILLLFCGSINLYSTARLILPLTTERVFLVCFWFCVIALASVMLFGCENGIGS